ncbi:DUF1048 domain-containing protein [Nonomuraea sp. NPDC050556]|uniref:DUF1048 domain-containing protein n=1 Tax=Nonomuraea sp. NPDC050556 TaxID=3364369 RepID=UPI00379FE6B7
MTDEKSGFRQYVEIVTGSLEDKKRWRQYKARIKALPPDYRAAVEALERYLNHLGSVDGSPEMWDDLADLFERAAADRTPIRDIFGEDPMEFVEAFVANYPLGQWIKRERNRFTSAIKRAAGEGEVLE